MSSPGHAKEVEVPAALPEPFAERPLEAVELAEVAAPTIDLLFPVGHFYSPIADPTGIESRRTAIFRPRDSSPGIDYRIEAQLALLEALQPYVAEIDYPIDDPLDGTFLHKSNNDYTLSLPSTVSLYHLANGFLTLPFFLSTTNFIEWRSGPLFVSNNNARSHPRGRPFL